MPEQTIALTANEAARELRISTATLFTWVKVGKVPAVRLGGRKLLFSRKEIERLVAGGKPVDAT